MASKRKLKNDVNFVVYELLNECFTLKHLNKEIDEKKFENVIGDLVSKRNELIARINHPVLKNGETIATYYNGVRSEMTSMVEMVEKLTK
jgi:hypothetical protein